MNFKVIGSWDTNHGLGTAKISYPTQVAKAPNGAAF